VEPALRVEHVGEGKQVTLVGAPAVVQHEQSRRVSRGLTLLEAQHGAYGSADGSF
jgi:hypothetical protein